MRNVVRLFLAWTSCAVGTHAADAEPPRQVWEFLRPLLVRETRSAGDIWSRTGSGGYVFRFDLDVTGDAEPDMFVASSLDWWKGNLFWAVFKKAKKPPTGYERLRQVPKDERIAQEVSEIWLEHLGQHVAFVGTGHDRHGADNFNWYIVRYVFSDTEIKFERQVVSKDTAAAVERWPTITKVKPAIYGVLLADLLENPDVQWRRIDFSDAAPDPDGYYIARSDVDRVRQIKDFTPQIALKRLDRILDNENVEPNKPEVQQLPRISPK